MLSREIILEPMENGLSNECINTMNVINTDNIGICDTHESLNDHQETIA